jgi:hypothetical protein
MEFGAFTAMLEKKKFTNPLCYNHSFGDQNDRVFTTPKRGTLIFAHFH